MNVQQISMEVQESMQNKGNYVFNGFITHCDYVWKYNISKIHNRIH